LVTAVFGITTKNLEIFEVYDLFILVPVLSRDARLVKSSVVMGFGKSIKVSVDAETIKVYNLDSLQPAITAAGKQSLSTRWA
jgi:hypothetical protein